MIQLEKVDKVSFHHQKVPLLFDENDDNLNKHFAILSNKINSFKFAWYSDIEPVIKKITPLVYCIGIDQHFSIIDFDSSKILVNLKLFYNFYNVEIINNFIFVISELEIIELSASNFTVIKSFDLPDYIKTIEFKEDNILVKFLDDSEIIVDII